MGAEKFGRMEKAGSQITNKGSPKGPFRGL